jgi:class 3 adenylate cyclase
MIDTAPRSGFLTLPVRKLVMAEERINRKLAAILAADVVGYSRVMGANEAGRLAALKRHRETIFDPTSSPITAGL